MLGLDYLPVPEGETATIVFSPWETRFADNIRVIVEVAAIYNASITIDLYEKNIDDIGDGTSKAGSISTASVGRTAPQEWTAVKEMVRYKITVAWGGTAGSGGWVLFRLLDLVWFDTVKG
jgi:hypothetical protein